METKRVTKSNTKYKLTYLITQLGVFFFRRINETNRLGKNAHKKLKLFGVVE